MHAVDLAIIVAYLLAVVGAGFYFGRRQLSTQRYFLGGHEVPWWAISASIVATETSTVTFISVPGIAFAAGGDFRFLQIVFGYLVARVVISVLFMPRYFRRELVTVSDTVTRVSRRAAALPERGRRERPTLARCSSAPARTSTRRARKVSPR